MNNNDDNTLDTTSLMWRGKKEFWVKEQLSDDLLDHYFLKEFDVVKHIIQCQKRSNDLALCNKWMGIFLRTTKEEKYARNWLLKLMKTQLNNGGMSYPFTDPQNSNRDVCCVLKDYESCRKRKGRDVDTLSSPLELKVPDPSSVSLKPVDSRAQGRKKTKTFTRPWNDICSTWQTVDSAPQQAPGPNEPFNPELLNLYLKQHYNKQDSELDLKGQIASNKNTLGVKHSQLGASIGCPDRAERDVRERERKLRDIEKRKEIEQAERRNREKQREQNKVKEAEKKKLQEQLLDKERMQKEKDHREMLFKVHQRREEERIRRETRKSTQPFLTQKEKALQEQQMLKSLEHAGIRDRLIRRMQRKESSNAKKQAKKDEAEKGKQLEKQAINAQRAKKVAKEHQLDEKTLRQKKKNKSMLRQERIEALNEKERLLSEELRRTESEVVYLQQKRQEAKEQKERNEMLEINMQHQMKEKRDSNTIIFDNHAYDKEKLKKMKQKLELMSRKQKQRKETENWDKKEKQIKEQQVPKGDVNVAQKLLEELQQKLKLKEKLNEVKAAKNQVPEENIEQVPEKTAEPKKCPRESKTVLIDMPRSKTEPALRVKVSDYDTEIGLEFENFNQDNEATGDRKHLKYQEKLCFNLQVDKQRNRLELAEEMMHKIAKEKKQLEMEINVRSKILDWLKVPENQKQILGDSRLTAGGQDEYELSSDPDQIRKLVKHAYIETSREQGLKLVLTDEETKQSTPPHSSQSSGEYFNAVPYSSNQKRLGRYMESESEEEPDYSSYSENHFAVEYSSDESNPSHRNYPKQKKPLEKQQKPMEEKTKAKPKSRTLLDFTQIKANLEKSAHSSEPIKRRICQLYQKQEKIVEDQEVNAITRPINERVPQLRKQYEKKLDRFSEEQTEKSQPKSQLLLQALTKSIQKHVCQLRQRYEANTEKPNEELVESQAAAVGEQEDSLSKPISEQVMPCDQPKDLLEDKQEPDSVEKSSENTQEEPGEVKHATCQNIKLHPDELRRCLEQYRELRAQIAEKEEAIKRLKEFKEQQVPVEQKEQEEKPKEALEERQSVAVEEHKDFQSKPISEQVILCDQPQVLLEDKREPDSTKKSSEITHQEEPGEVKPVSSLNIKLHPDELRRCLEQYRELRAQIAMKKEVINRMQELYAKQVPEEQQKQVQKLDKPLENQQENQAQIAMKKEAINRMQDFKEQQQQEEKQEQEQKPNEALEERQTVSVDKQADSQGKIISEHVISCNEPKALLEDKQKQDSMEKSAERSHKEEPKEEKPVNSQHIKCDSDKVHRYREVRAQIAKKKEATKRIQEQQPQEKQQEQKPKEALEERQAIGAEKQADSQSKPMSQQVILFTEPKTLLEDKHEQDSQEGPGQEKPVNSRNIKCDPEKMLKYRELRAQIAKKKEATKRMQDLKKQKLPEEQQKQEQKLDKPLENQQENRAQIATKKEAINRMLELKEQKLSEEEQKHEQKLNKPIENHHEQRFDPDEVRRFLDKYRRESKTCPSSKSSKPSVVTNSNEEKQEKLVTVEKLMSRESLNIKTSSQSLTRKISAAEDLVTQLEVPKRPKAPEPKKSIEVLSCSSQQKVESQLSLKSKNSGSPKQQEKSTESEILDPVKEKESDEKLNRGKDNQLSKSSGASMKPKVTITIVKTVAEKKLYEKRYEVIDAPSEHVVTSKSSLKLKTSSQSSVENQQENAGVPQQQATIGSKAETTPGQTPASQKDHLKACKRQRRRDSIKIRRKHDRKQLRIIAAKICNLSFKKEVKDIFTQAEDEQGSAFNSSQVMRKQLRRAIKIIKYQLRQLQKELRQRLQKTAGKSFPSAPEPEKSKEICSRCSHYHKIPHLRKHLLKLNALLTTEFRHTCCKGHTDDRRSCKLAVMRLLSIGCFGLLNRIFRSNIKCESSWIDALKTIERLYFQQLNDFIKSDIASPNQPENT